MTTRIISAALLGASIIGLNACKSGGGMKTIKGMEYTIVKDEKGPNAKIGEVVEFNLRATCDTTTISDTWKMGHPAAQPVDSPHNSTDLMAILPMLSAGDSALVYISCDSIIAGIPAEQMSNKPEWMQKGKKIKIELSIVSVKSKDQAMKDMENKRQEEMKKIEEQKAAQLPVDDKTLQEYFAKNNIKAEKTASGLYYTIQSAGSGKQIEKGQTVSMMYTGKTLDGHVFDSNMDEEVAKKNGHGSDPLTFVVGMGQMIPGVDEGAGLLKKGAKATLYLPSPIAYGPQSPSPEIPANAIMIFEVEIKDVKAAENK
ncbi:MAG: FKBP-type peptidyl-prolyl cis-trans isomerase [Taibaiella sp.]|nr:FKBP-type peptidyl-prolyl cis-trans isomerase [Taibaiella sp.]